MDVMLPRCFITFVVASMVLFCHANADFQEGPRQGNNPLLSIDQQSLQAQRSFNASNIILGGGGGKKTQKKNKKRRSANKKISIPLRHAEGSSWGMVGGIKVGHPYVDVEVMFDTQSSNILMFHPDITDSSVNGDYEKSLFNENNRFYDPDDSKSSVVHEDDNRFEYKYPDGSVYHGGTVDDRMLVGSAAFKSHGNTFASVRSMNSVAAYNKGGDLDGIVGLGGTSEFQQVNSWSTRPSHQVEEEKKISRRNKGACDCGLMKKEVDGQTHTQKGQKQYPLAQLTCENDEFRKGAMIALFDELADFGGKIDKDYLKAPVFAFYVSQSGKTGEIMFGGHNKKLIGKDKMVYSPALSQSPTGKYDIIRNKWEDHRIHVYPEDDTSWRCYLYSRLKCLISCSCNEAEGESEMMLRGNMVPKPESQPPQNVVWGIKINELSLGNAEVEYDNDFYALFSSTSPYGMTFPQREWLSRIKNIIGNGAKLMDEGDLVIECEKLKDLPELALTIGGGESGHKLTFTPMEYFPNVDASGEKCSSFFGIVPDEEASRRGGEDLVVQLGIPFMKKYYVEYDYGAIEESVELSLGNLHFSEEMFEDFFEGPPAIVTYTRKPARIGIALSKGVEMKYKSTKKKRKY